MSRQWQPEAQEERAPGLYDEQLQRLRQEKLLFRKTGKADAEPETENAR